MPTPSRRAAAALALLTGAGLLALSGLEPGPMLAAETRFLGLLTTGVLLGLAAVEPRLPPVVGPLVLALAWWLPGTGRPAVLVGVLAAALAASLGAGGDPGRRGGTGRRPLAQPFRDGLALVGFAVALQLLTTSRELLAPTPGELALEIVGPILPIALAARPLARRPGPGVVLGMTALAVIGPGIGWVGALTLAGLALADRETGLRWLGPLVPWTSPAALGVGGSIAVGLALLERESAKLRRAVAVVTSVLALALVPAFAGPSIALYPLILLPLLAPALVGPGVLTVAGAALTLLGAALVDVVHGATSADLLVPGVLLVAWTTGPRHRLAATGLLAAVSGGTAVLAASYPWHRPEPLEAALSGLVPRPAIPWTLGIVVAAIACDRWAPPRFGRAAIAAALVAGVVLAAPRVERVPIDEAPVVLSADRPVVELELPAGADLLIVDSQASNAQHLPAGRPVAMLWIRDTGGAVLERHGIAIGEETGDWASGRSDLEGTVAAPPAWAERVAVDGDFFSRRYRARFRVGSADADRRLEIRRVRALSPETRLVIHRVEARRAAP